MMIVKCYMQWLLITSIGLLGCSAKKDIGSSQYRMPILGERLFDAKAKDTIYYAVNGINLYNQDKELVNDDTFAKDKISIVSFFFTRCPSICPVLIKNLQDVATHFLQDDQVSLHSISIDPLYDNADRLKAFVQKNAIRKAQWTFYSGSQKDIFELAKNCKLKAFDDPDAGLVHEPHVVLLDAKRRIRGYYDALDKPSMKVLINDINKLKEEQAYLSVNYE